MTTVEGQGALLDPEWLSFMEFYMRSVFSLLVSVIQGAF